MAEMKTPESHTTNLILTLLILALFSTVCAKGGKLHCPWNWSRWHGGCYRLINEPKKSWDDAEAFCCKYRLAPRRCRGKTAHLVTVDSEEENHFLYHLWRSHDDSVALSTNQHFWIGMNDKEEEGIFVLINGNAPEYLNWANDQPKYVEDQDCVQMIGTNWTNDYDSGRWDDAACGVTSSFVCEFRCH